MSRHRRSYGREIHGIFLLDKSTGMSSNDALQKVKRIFNANKAGHTGALDPLATGMLPICFGEATKFSQFLLDSDKTYLVTALLGVRTDTSDSDGSVVSIRDVNVSEQQIKDVITEKFVGNLQQVPSMYSALKYNGKPLYKYARENIEVERQARPITVYSNDFISFVDNKLTLEISCSKGTYIRTIIDDLGEVLGCGAHVISLRRLKVAGYPEDRMRELSFLEQLSDDAIEQGIQPKDKLDQLLLPMDTVVNYMPKVVIEQNLLAKMLNGQAIAKTIDYANNTSVRLYTQVQDVFLGVGEYEDGKILPRKLVRSEEVMNIAGPLNYNQLGLK